MTKEADGKYIARALRCHACAARERAHDEFSRDNSDPSGMYYVAERIDD